MEIGSGNLGSAQLTSKTRPSQGRFDLVTVWVFLGSSLLLAPFATSVIPPSIEKDSHVEMDEGTYLHDGYRLSKGEIPYRDFFTFIGPVAPLITATAYTLFGEHIAAVRGLHYLLLSLAAVCVYLVARRMNMPRWLASLLAVGQIASLTAFWPLAYHHWVGVAFGMAALERCSAFIHSGSARSAKVLTWAGVFAAASLLAIQSYGLPLLVAMTAAIELRSRRGALYLFVGAGALVVATAVVFGLAGGLEAWVYDCWIWPFMHYRSVNAASYGARATAYLHQVSEWGPAPYLCAVLILSMAVVVPLLGFGLSALMVTRRVVGLLPARLSRGSGPEQTFEETSERVPPDQVFLVALVTLAVLSPLVLGVSLADPKHIAFAAFGTTLSLWAAAAWLRRPMPKALVQKLAAAVVVVTFAAGVGLWSWRLLRHPVSLSDFTQADEIPRQASGVEVFRAFAGVDRPVMWVRWSSAWLHIYGIPSVSPYNIMYSNYSGFSTEQMWQEFAEQIVEHRPPVIIVNGAEFMMLATFRPEIAEMYQRWPWLTVLRGHLGPQSGSSRWSLVENNRFDGRIAVTHFGRRFIGTIQSQTVFGVEGEREVAFVRIDLHGFYRVYHGRRVGDQLLGHCMSNYGEQCEFSVSPISKALGSATQPAGTGTSQSL